MQAILTKPEAGANAEQDLDGEARWHGNSARHGLGGRDAPATALEQRLTELKPLADAVILRDVKVGMKTGRQTVRMDFGKNMGDLYPFSLGRKTQGHH